MPKLKPGDPIPHFRLEDQHGATRSTAGYIGRRLLVYFYPRANTPG